MKLIDRIAAHHKISTEGLALKFVRAATSYNAKAMIATAVANTAAIDLTDEVVVPGGVERDAEGKIAYFGSMKAIYLNHNYEIMPVGTMVNTALRGGSWVVQFMLHGRTEASRDLAALYALGEDNPVRGTSIGFVRKAAGTPTDEEIERYGPTSWITREWKWIELSATAQPCNPEAMLLESGEMPETGDARSIEAIEGLVRKSIIHRGTAHALGLPKERRVVTVPRHSRVVTVRPEYRIVEVAA